MNLKKTLSAFLVTLLIAGCNGADFTSNLGTGINSTGNNISAGNNTSTGGDFVLPPRIDQSTSSYYNSSSGQSYYSSASEKIGLQLKTALHNKIKGHSSKSYSSLWTHFKSTDNKGSNKVWDMYSNYTYYYTSDQCGTYKKEGDCYNREHSFPQSWFKSISPMDTDLFHIYPTDGYVNGIRDNYPFGETSNPEVTTGNGSKKGFSSFPGYAGRIFEPINEYKGDFARTYFYMATRYQDVASNWSCDMLNPSSDLLFRDWAINLLLKWHRNDPVSNKEFARNDAIFNIQNNRNPFIDNPNWADDIWG